MEVSVEYCGAWGTGRSSAGRVEAREQGGEGADLGSALPRNGLEPQARQGGERFFLYSSISSIAAV